MAVTVTATYPNGGTEADFYQYATEAGKEITFSFYIASSGDRVNQRFKVEILNATGGTTLLTSYMPAVVNGGVCSLPLDIGRFINSMIERLSKPEYEQDYINLAADGSLSHKVKVTAIFGEPAAEKGSVTIPSTGFFTAHKAKELDLSGDVFLKSVATATETLDRNGSRQLTVFLNDNWGDYVKAFVTKYSSAATVNQTLADADGNTLLQLGNNRTVQVPITSENLGSFAALNKIEVKFQKYIEENPTAGATITGIASAGGGTEIEVTVGVDFDLAVTETDYVLLQATGGESVYNNVIAEVTGELDGNVMTLGLPYFNEPGVTYEVAAVYSPSSSGITTQTVKTYNLVSRCANTITFRNQLGGFDSLDMIRQSEAMNGEGIAINLNGVKERHGVTAKKITSYGGVNAYGNTEKALALVRSEEHWTEGDKVILLTDSVNVYNIREFTEIQIEVEHEDY